jgi:hypothetical protein
MSITSSKTSVIELGYVIVVGEPSLHEACHRARLPAPISFVRARAWSVGRWMDRQLPLAVMVSPQVASEKLRRLCAARGVPLHVVPVSAVGEDVERSIVPRIETLGLSRLTQTGAPRSIRSAYLARLEAGWGA